MNRNEFHVTYRDELWRAYAFNADRGTYTLREVGYGLEELFTKCKAAGLNWDGYANDEAINEVRDWAERVKPAFSVMKALWEPAESQREDTPRRRIGFRLPHDSD